MFGKCTDYICGSNNYNKTLTEKLHVNFMRVLNLLVFFITVRE